MTAPALAKLFGVLDELRRSLGVRAMSITESDDGTERVTLQLEAYTDTQACAIAALFEMPAPRETTCLRDRWLGAWLTIASQPHEEQVCVCGPFERRYPLDSAAVARMDAAVDAAGRLAKERGA